MKDTIEKFYKAFSKLDAEEMISCYHKDIQFEDPAFGILKGEKARNMWRMLCQSQHGKDFKIKASNIQSKEQKGGAHWEAFYIFSKTNRKVHNVIHAEFVFEDGKIIQHTDKFDLYRWSRQALGFQGLLIGWSPYFKKKLKIQTNKLLSAFEQGQSKYNSKEI